jgi:hypothetical protein
MLIFVMGWLFGVVSAALGLAWYRIVATPPVIHNGPPRSVEDMRLQEQMNRNASMTFAELDRMPPWFNVPMHLRQGPYETADEYFKRSQAFRAKS